MVGHTYLLHEVCRVVHVLTVVTWHLVQSKTRWCWKALKYMCMQPVLVTDGWWWCLDLCVSTQQVSFTDRICLTECWRWIKQDWSDPAGLSQTVYTCSLALPSGKKTHRPNGWIICCKIFTCSYFQERKKRKLTILKNPGTSFINSANLAYALSSHRKTK